MRRNVMISTATVFTAIAATAPGGITTASAASAAHVPTKLTGVPKAAIAVRDLAPSLRKAAGPAAVCIAVAAATTKSVKGVAKPAIARAAIAVPAPAPTSSTKPALLAPTTVTFPAEVCVTLVPAQAPTSVKKGW